MFQSSSFKDRMRGRPPRFLFDAVRLELPFIDQMHYNAFSLYHSWYHNATQFKCYSV